MLQAYAIAGGKLAPASSDAGALGRALWIDVSEPTGQEQATLEQALGIKLRLPEEPARFQVSSPLRSSDGSLTLTALLLAGLAERRPRLITVSFILGSGPLITVTKGGAGGLGWLARECEQVAVTNSTDAFQVLLDMIVEHITDVLDHVGEQLDQLNRALFQHRTTRRLRERLQASPRRRNRQLERILTELGYGREVLVKLRRSVLSFHHVVSLLRERNSGMIPARRLESFEQELQALAQVEEDLSSTSAFMLDGAVGYIGILQSRTINIMTIVGVLLTPPVLVASIYGMNFKHMPELSWTWGYGWALTLMALSALLTYVLVRVRGWL
jgi:magnesium transporter